MDANNARFRIGVVVALGWGSLLVGGCGRSAPEDAAPTTDPTVAVNGETTVPTTSIPTQVTYVIQPGESLSLIAARFGVDVRALADFNAIGDIDSVRAGQLLTIPPVPTTPDTTTPEATPSETTTPDTTTPDPTTPVTPTG
jgi:LysM repeat protein